MSTEKHAKVTATPTQEGPWGWISDIKLVYHPEEYWKPGMKIPLNLKWLGAQATDKIWLKKNSNDTSPIRNVSCVIKVDIANYTTTVVENGEVVKILPPITGKESSIICSGTKLILEEHDNLRMNSDTIAIPSGSPEAYNLSAQYVMRVTWTGESAHAALWSVGPQGKANVSHGCVGLSIDDAEWLYEGASTDDIIEFTGSDRKMKPSEGMRVWFYSWEGWKALSASGPWIDRGAIPGRIAGITAPMPVIVSVILPALASVATPSFVCSLERNAGWPLSAPYAATAMFEAPTAGAVMVGEWLAWSANWLSALGVRLAFTANGLGLVFSLIALLTGVVVFAYSMRYLTVGRNYALHQMMTAFVLSMQALVLTDDPALLPTRWELTSLASSLSTASAGNAGEGASMHTPLIIFAGSALLLPAIAAIWRCAGATSLSGVFSHKVQVFDPGLTTPIVILVALAGSTKAVQLLLHVWLPDTVVVTTPVSAYLHAAAVVKAGTSLLLRSSPVLHVSAVWNGLLVTVGLITTYVGGYFALGRIDAGKLMVYSTISQPGLLTASIGLGVEAGVATAVLHTIVYALLRSRLFMMVGVINHSTDTHDLRHFLPGLYKRMSLSSAVMALGRTSIADAPSMLGFVSKEVILASPLGAPGVSRTGLAAFPAAVLGSVPTFAYCVCVLLGIFFGGTGENRSMYMYDPLLAGSATLPILVFVPLATWFGGLSGPAASAAGATLGGTAPGVHLALWHGLGTELYVTADILFPGSVTVWRCRTLADWVLQHRFPLSGSKVMWYLMERTCRLGALLTRSVALDTAIRHIIPILGLLGVIDLTSSRAANFTDLRAQQPGLTKSIDVVAFVLTIAAIIGVYIFRVYIASMLSLSVVGILATVQTLALEVSDVALAQLLVENLSIIVIMLVLQQLPVRLPVHRRSRNLSALTASALVGGGVTTLTWALTARCDESDLAKEFLECTKELASGDNVVNVILVEFRGLDTLDELSVPAMTVVAILALLSTARDRYTDPPGDNPYLIPMMASQINQNPRPRTRRAIMEAWPDAVGLQVMSCLMTPLLIVIPVVLSWREHNSPDGGFNVALVTSSLVGLIYPLTVKDRSVGPPRLLLLLIGGGIMLAVATGFLGLFLTDPLLQPTHGEILGTHLITSMILDASVYLAALGLILVSFSTLDTTRGTRAGGGGTHRHIDELLKDEFLGPPETVRGGRPRHPTIRTRFITEGTRLKEIEKWP